MKKTAVAILLFAAAVSATTAEARKTTPETIYRKGWIDFNKNGRMDPYEDPSRNLDERVEDPARPHDPRREELPAGHALRLWPRAARLAAHRGVEERGLEGRHRQHRRDAQRRGQEPAHDAASGLRLHGPRQGEEHDPALVRRADPAGHPRGVHQRGHPRTEPQPRHAAPGAHRHRIDLEPGAGAPCGRDRRTRSPGPGLPERLRPDPRRGARSPLGPRRGVLRRRPVPDRRTGRRDGPRHPVAGRRLDAQTLRGLQRPEGAAATATAAPIPTSPRANSTRCTSIRSAA